ncbi:MAG: amidohydrolase family protein [Candidatus Brocadiia bacterium]
MFIDFHVPVYDEPGYGEALADTARNIGLDRLCLMGGSARYGLAANAQVRHVADSYPELFVPFARIRLGQDGPSAVERLRRIGFSGLCTWAPPAPYDDEAFFPVYEAAQALEMPVLFHTAYLPVTALDRPRGVRSANMRPVYLDTVARCFPRLTVVGVGLGNPWYEEAAETMRGNDNVFFDLSGRLLRQKGPEWLTDLLGENQNNPWAAEQEAQSLWRHVVFGSGVRQEDIASVERDYERVFRWLGVAEEETSAVMGQTAARLLGIGGQS